MYRRYNDFVVFHEMLLQKFPYRMVPALPPKRVLGGIGAGRPGGGGAGQLRVGGRQDGWDPGSPWHVSTWPGRGCGAGCRPTPCSASAADREFIEARRRALRRFINLVARHPPFSEDVALRLFLSFSGPVSLTVLWVYPESLAFLSFLSVRAFLPSFCSLRSPLPS